MKKSTKKFYTSLIFFLSFAIFTVFVKIVDVRPIGPNGSEVGFAAINEKAFGIIGTNSFWFDFSERLGYMALLVCVIFGCIGALQFIKGKSFKAVDSQIVLLGIFYIIVIAFYVFFDKLAINFRPVLEADGSLEASYPSSHTVLSVCVFSTMFMQKVFNRKGSQTEHAENVVAATILVTLMVVSRLLSGVHWLTDIAGGVLLSVALISLYKAAVLKGNGE